MSDFARRHPLAAPVAAALVLRLAAWFGVESALEFRHGDFVVAGDAGGYVELASDLASGRAYAIDRLVPFPRRAMRSPGFPLALTGPVKLDLLLGVPRWQGFGRWSVARLSVALTATLAVWATGRLGRAVGGERVGVVAAWIAAVNPLAIAFGVMLLSETLFALLATLSLWGVAECVRPDDDRARPSPRWLPAVWGGLAAAGATLTRSVWLPMPFAIAALAALLAWRGRNWKSAAWAGIFLLAFGAGYATWPLRNAAVLGEPVLTTTWAGPTLYDSLGPQATGASDMRFRDRFSDSYDGAMDYGAIPPGWVTLTPIWFAYSVEYPKLTGIADENYEVFKRATAGDELASDRLYRRAALDAAKADPLRVAKLAIVKQGRFWRPWPVGGLPGGWVGAALKVGFAAYFVPLIALAVWGGWRFRGEPAAQTPGVRSHSDHSEEQPTTHGRSLRSGLTPVWNLVLTWGPVLGFAGVCLVFVGSVRYRLPGEFPLAVAAACGLLALRRRPRDAGG